MARFGLHHRGAGHAPIGVERGGEDELPDSRRLSGLNEVTSSEDVREHEFPWGVERGPVLLSGEVKDAVDAMEQFRELLHRCPAQSRFHEHDPGVLGKALTSSRLQRVEDQDAVRSLVEELLNDAGADETTPSGDGERGALNVDGGHGTARTLPKNELTPSLEVPVLHPRSGHDQAGSDEPSGGAPLDSVQCHRGQDGESGPRVFDLL